MRKNSATFVHKQYYFRTYARQGQLQRVPIKWYNTRESSNYRVKYEKEILYGTEENERQTQPFPFGCTD